MKRVGTFWLALVTMTASGCAVVSSYRTDAQAPEHSGVSYYLPKRDVIVTLTVAKDAPPTFAVSGTAAYPDLSTRFVARYRQSVIGDDKLNIGVTPNGLLTSTTADFTSQLPAILVNVAKAAGMGVARAGKPPKKVECKCQSPGTYADRFEIRDPDKSSGTSTLCGYSVEISRIGNSKVAENAINALKVCPCAKEDKQCNKKARCSGYSGLFYRQQEPYLVTINSDGACGLPVQRALVFSPNNAPLEFLPVERGLFANANAAFAFEDGSLTSYEQRKASELLALSALPADIMTAYFTAIGSMFQLRTTNATNEANLEKALTGLLVQQQKSRACEAALAANDTAAIQANCQ